MKGKIAQRIRKNLQKAKKTLSQKSTSPRPAATRQPGDEWPEEQRGDAWEPPQEEPESEGGERGYRFQPITSEAFFTNDYAREWLVQRILVAGQPAVVGGPKKTLKTNTLVDLCVSLTTATPFFGRFEVYRKHRVVIISGESGEATLQESGRRVCAARGVDPRELDLWWDFRLPQVANALDRQRLCQGLKDLGASVVVLDPLYLCMLSGMDARDVEAGNLYKMGPLLLQLSRACLDAGATPILCHHSRKGSSQTFEPLDLDDLAFSGIAEFARQWILENRREPFDPNTGSSKLWMSVGGSSGQSGCWAVDVEEGVLNDDFTGRKWNVTVHTTSEVRSYEQQVKDSKKAAEENRRHQEFEKRFLSALDETDPHGSGASFTQVRNLAGLSSDKANQTVFRLVQAGILERIPSLEVTIGNGAVRSVLGVRRVPESPWKGTSGSSG